MQLTQGNIVRDLWLFFAFYWLVTSMNVNKMRKREPWGQRLAFLLVFVACCILVMYAGEHFGILDRRFVPARPWIAWLGIALEAAGIAFAIWARNHIGKYWSASVSLREGHELIRSGPYARIRHPIYSGMLLAAAGITIWSGRWGALIVLGFALFAVVVKAKKEEALLAGEFGPAFDEHRHRTGFLLPRLSA
jgi:protein-S-isoprenylcysteine O-methyltransferase Ste14